MALFPGLGGQPPAAPAPGPSNISISGSPSPPPAGIHDIFKSVTAQKVTVTDNQVASGYVPELLVSHIHTTA